MSHKASVHAALVLWQDFLICIEMFVAAIAHRFAFSYKVQSCLKCEERDGVATSSRPTDTLSSPLRSFVTPTRLPRHRF